MAMGNDPTNQIDPDGGFCKVPRSSDEGSTYFGGSDWMQNLQSSMWMPFNKSDLKIYTENMFPTFSEGQIQNAAGHLFEGTFHDYVRINQTNVRFTNYRSNPTHLSVQPDGVANPIMQTFNPNTMQHHTRPIIDGALFEVKAKNGNVYESTSSWQIGGYINYLLTNQPQNVLQGKSFLYFITTSNVKLGRALRNKIIASRINFIHLVAQYRMNGNTISIRFVERTYSSNGSFTDTAYPHHFPVNLR
jgi:hypothetical protein